MNYSLRLQTIVLLPPNILEGDVSNVVSIKLNAFTIKAPKPSRQVRATPTSITIGVDFGTHTFLGPWG